MTTPPFDPDDIPDERTPPMSERKKVLAEIGRLVDSVPPVMQETHRALRNIIAAHKCRPVRWVEDRVIVYDVCSRSCPVAIAAQDLGVRDEG